MKKIIKRIIILIPITIIMVITIMLIVLALNPLRRQSTQDIYEYVMELTPIGMSMGEVLRVIARQDWELWRVNENHGFIRPGPSDPEDFALGRHTRVGEKSIIAILGTYTGGHGRVFFSYTGVVAYWGFDENGILIDVIVIKETDRL